jgi:hypothetical protein
MGLVQIAVLWLVVFIVVAHLLAPAGYRWTRDTVSRLGQRGHRRFWILRTGMAGYGSLMFAATIWREAPVCLLGLYGLGVFLAGIVPVAPPDTTDENALLKGRIHDVSIYAAGACLVAAIIWHLGRADQWPERLHHATPLALVLIFEIGFNLPDEHAVSRWRGLLQRGLHLTTLVWIALSQS